MVVREGSWQSQSVASASGGSYLYGGGNEQDVLILPFSGTTVEVLYVAGPNLGTLALEVDGTVLRTVITTADQTAYHQTTSLNYLTDETHTLRVYAQAGGVVAVDAFVARLSSIVDVVETAHLIGNQPRSPTTNPIGTLVYTCTYNSVSNNMCLVSAQHVPNPAPIPLTTDGNNFQPEWSPDGRHIIQAGSSGPWPSPIGLGTYQQDQTGQWIPSTAESGYGGIVYNESTILYGKLAWSPDGKKIAYAVGEDGSPTSIGIYLMDLTQCTSSNGCISTPLITDGDSNTNDVDPAWSPDGQRLVYTHQVGSQWQLYTFDFQTQQRQAIAGTENYAHHPDWSRNNELTAAGQGAIWRMSINCPSGSACNIVGNPPQPQQVTFPQNRPDYTEVDSEPEWSPDGTRIAFTRYFISATSQGYVVATVTISSGYVKAFGTGHSPRWWQPTSCVFQSPYANGESIDSLRAPISYNLRDVNLSFSTPVRFQVDEQFTDHLGVIWYHVTGVTENNGDPISNTDISSRGGVWIQSNGTWDNISEIGTKCSDHMIDLPASTKYTIPNIPWNTFAFSNWPLDTIELCRTGVRREIHALGIARETGEIDLPQNTHHAVDLFVQENDAPGQSDPLVSVLSLGNGIVVGMGKSNYETFMDNGVQRYRSKDETYSHAFWGASQNYDGDGYSVIVRYGHLYVLYGHLREVDANIWVGSLVRSGQRIGDLGDFNERHLHLEVHSWGNNPIPDFLDGTNPPQLTDIPTGILPRNTKDKIGSTRPQQDPPYVYDFLQLLGYNSGNSQLTAIAQAIATANLVPGPNQGEGNIALSVTGCTDTIQYQTRMPNVEVVLTSEDGYRGFHIEGDTSQPSPLDLPPDTPIN